ncbi:RCC1-like G exchanging factor-like protein isoform X1 [Amphibalanus amphitrite]|uniref:RCC1-like G exchanging factor-like protein isoform X1 n=2 Tax=Amphibalanus amphitrite TaxID=1232801 RepID=UPI001C917D65|nr:RCC1-like G exchanging factor-like protein isoform X1 [Amphibalanus amphitrite]
MMNSVRSCLLSLVSRKQLTCSRGVKHWIDGKPRRKHPVNPEIEDRLPVNKYISEGTRPDNRVYTWGYAELGALGNRNLLRPKNGKKPYTYLHRPMRLWFAELNKVTDVACGYGFTVMAVNRPDYKLFGCGLNTSSQIGQQEARAGHPLERVTSPVPITIPVDDPSIKVTAVACGRSHTAFVTSDGAAYTLGNNAYGQCGRQVLEREDYSSNATVHRVPLELPVRTVTCGQDHTMFLTECGRVFCCGWGADGQLGSGAFDSRWQALPAGGDLEGERIVKVACSADCVLAVSESGDVFGWGNSEYAQFASVTEEQQLNVPRRLPLGVGRVTDVASAGTMCAVLNDRGEVYVWGYGMLGKGPELDVSKEPSLIPPTLLGRNDFSPDNTPVSVVSGLYHLSVTTSGGDLFTWGHNRHGALGLGHTEDRLFPLRVSIPARVTKVACGVDHMAALCREYI